MKSVVGVYESHIQAIDAVKELKAAGYPVKNISLLGKAIVPEDHRFLKSNKIVEEAEVSVGVVTGAVLGVLTGVGIFAIPGLGFLYGAGALIGAIAGFDIGLVGGGLVAILTSVGIDEIHSHRYDQLISENKFIIIIQGNEGEITHARELLHTQSHHMDVNSH
jgi:uncharacterized membrane protein